MANYATPGVYVEEVSLLPSSIAPVSTAVPVFLGAVHTAAGEDLELDQVARIATLLEFEQVFGTTTPTPFTVDAEDQVKASAPMPAYLLWYAMKHYFDNGGGVCYVVAVRRQDPDATATDLTALDFKRGFEKLATLDEPTLVVMPEAVLLSVADRKEVYVKALAHCGEHGSRFAILDAHYSADIALKDDIDAARKDFGTSNLSYGACYYPYLATTLTHRIDEDQVMVEVVPEDGAAPAEPITLASLADSASDHYDTARYNLIKRNLRAQRVQLPPSAAIAGVYARVDRSRGVWKAPANVDLLSTLGPSRALTDAQQAELNVDPGGKSINAIRAFSGRGTIVWGARTLDGNSAEWRYVNVRRLFLMIEESSKRASQFSIFEPNDATTWLKVRGMIESFLYSLWEQGALQGASPEQAYYVRVGENVTMTRQDVLDGKLIVEIGVAAVRPAEFIILRFSHFTGQA